jgi:chromosome segregation ATPase
MEESDYDRLHQIVQEQRGTIEKLKRENALLRQENQSLQDRDSLVKEMQVQLQNELRAKADIQVSINNLKRQFERSLPFQDKAVPIGDDLSQLNEFCRNLVSSFIQLKKNSASVNDEKIRLEEALGNQRSIHQKLKTEKLQLENSMRTLESTEALLQMQIRTHCDDSERYKKLAEDLQKKIEKLVVEKNDDIQQWKTKFLNASQELEGINSGATTRPELSLAKSTLGSIRQISLSLENDWKANKIPQLQLIVQQIKENLQVH